MVCEPAARGDRCRRGARRPRGADRLRGFSKALTCQRVPGGDGDMSKVKLVGVGPGHPGLATVQAVEAIKDPDVIRHSDGCGVGLLHLPPATAYVAPFQSTHYLLPFP